jgi:hypothetical protein
MNSKNKSSQLDIIIPPEIKNDKLYKIIQKIAKEGNIKTALEIGSSSGAGSTEAFVKGLRENPNQPTLFCMEVSQTRFTELNKCYEHEEFVKCYNLSSVSIDEFPPQEEVIDFYNNIDSKLKKYTLNQVLGWLVQDIEYIKNSDFSAVNGIEKIKKDNQIEHFDLVLIDGSEFTGAAELKQVYGSEFILLDDITTFKNYRNHFQLIADPQYALISQNKSVRNGYSVFRKVSKENADLASSEKMQWDSLDSTNISIAGLLKSCQKWIENKWKLLTKTK